ncbi:MAG: YkgJ family cysteine cluster protein [Planctomycetota bacterium]|nr:MAG: YkgJ family cysteine cluster protein [Planctomycetota bacterium]
MSTVKEAPKDAAPVPFEKTKCGGCTALCCRYFALEIDTPDEPEDFENLRWYLIHEDTNLFIDEGDWYLQIFRKCTWLGKDNACSRYEDRPSICREYDDDWCDLDGASDGDITFRTIEELESYRDEWVAKYEAKRARKKKKAKRKAKAKRR